MSADKTSAAVADAARKRWATSGARRIPIDLIGAFPENRGKLGVSPWHVHEVYCARVPESFACMLEMNERTRICIYIHIYIYTYTCTCYGIHMSESNEFAQLECMSVEVQTPSVDIAHTVRIEIVFAEGVYVYLYRHVHRTVWNL